MGRLDGGDFLTAVKEKRAKKKRRLRKEPPFLFDLEADEAAGRSI